MKQFTLNYKIKSRKFWNKHEKDKQLFILEKLILFLFPSAQASASGATSSGSWVLGQAYSAHKVLRQEAMSVAH